MMLYKFMTNHVKSFICILSFQTGYLFIYPFFLEGISLSIFTQCFFVKVLGCGTVNLRSKSSVEYDISELGFRRRRTGKYKTYSSDKTYRCSSNEMHIFGSVGSGSSCVVRRAIYIPTHRITALKKINVFEKVSFYSPCCY